MTDISPLQDSDESTATRILTLADASAMLQCHRTTISRLVAEGQLGCIRYSDRPGSRMLFTKELIDEFLARRARRAVEIEPPKPVHRSMKRRDATFPAARSPWESKPEYQAELF